MNLMYFALATETIFVSCPVNGMDFQIKTSFNGIAGKELISTQQQTNGPLPSGVYRFQSVN